jgi:multidrug efflux pump
MNLSSPFIRRPVATTLMTLGVLLAGLVAFRLLPVAPLPNVDYPVINVQASLPGASPDTMATTVATPLERALGRIAGVDELTSSSTLGRTSITVQFDLDRNIDSAARDVQAAINASRSTLPSGMPSNPTYRKVNPADAPIMILALTSDTLTRGQIYDAASTILAQKLSQAPGVGNVNVGGGALPAVRVEVDLPRLNSLGIGLEQVRSAIVGSNALRPKGVIDSGGTHWQIDANDQRTTAADYVPLIVAYHSGSAIRLGDIAQVTDSVQDLRNDGSTNGKPSVQLIVYRQPGANVIATVDGVKALLPALRASIPPSIDLQVVMERTTTIKASLREVERSLIVAVLLVVAVVYLFLRSGRATLIPAVAVPVSLVATFGAMYLLGYSLDNLSLMALTVATGFVVDDAIVVLEVISRHVEEGMRPFEAALAGAREVAFTVLSMSLSLVAVFVPIVVMGGLVGRLFREFGVTLSVAVLMSMVVSLATTPMMCAQLLRRGGNTGAAATRAGGRVWRWLDAVGTWSSTAYVQSLRWALRHESLTMAALLATMATTAWLYVVVPKGFFPQQDIGFMLGSIQADQATSFQAMRDKVLALAAIVKRDPAVENVTSFTGGGQRNGGFVFVTLKPRAERGVSADEINARLRPQFAAVPGARLFLVPAQDIRVGGRSANAQYQYTLQADDLAELKAWTPRVQNALAKVPQLVDVNTDQQDQGLQTSLQIDRPTAARLGVTPAMIDAALNDAFGQRQVSTIYRPLNQYHVVLEAAPRYWQRPESLQDIHVVTSSGTSVPLAAFAHWEPTSAPLAVNHQGGYAASTLSFNLPPGVSLSQAGAAIDRAVADLGLPSSIHASFQGTAQAFQQSLATLPVLLLAAVAAVYIVLGILYESYVHPITILSTLPSAGAGALLALLCTGAQLTVIAFIGIILLVGIVKKNAIMMVDVAIKAQRADKTSSEDAIVAACQRRLRPILMTTCAALLGALPLALAAGEGSELRRPLGIAIVGGLVVSQLLTLYTTPALYVLMDRLRLRAARWRSSVWRGRVEESGHA